MSSDSDDNISPEPTPKSRANRRREDTRRRLIKATYEIIAQRGFESVVIKDITERADVGYGSFYRHFPSKEAIVGATIDAARLHIKQMHERLDDLARDRVEAFAMDLRLWLHHVKTNKVWGWFMIRTVLSGEELGSSIGGVLKRALYAGITDGTFKHNDIEIVNEITCGLLLLSTLKLVSMPMPEGYCDRIVSSALKTVAVPDNRIKAVISKPLPVLDFPHFLEASGSFDSAPGHQIFS